MYDAWLFERTRIAGALALLSSAILLAISEISHSIVAAVVVALLASLWYPRLDRPYDVIAIVLAGASGGWLLFVSYGRGDVPLLAIVVGVLFALTLSQLVVPEEITEA